jgi:hypothetical protein
VSCGGLLSSSPPKQIIKGPCQKHGKKNQGGNEGKVYQKKPPHEILCQSPLLFFLITMQYINRVLKIYVNVHQKWFMKGERKHQITENQFFRVSTGLLNVEG